MQKKEVKKQKTMRLLAFILTMAILVTTQGFTAVAQTVSENEVKTVENEVVTVENKETQEEIISGNSVSENVVKAATESFGLDPVHHCTKQDNGSDKTTWSYVYFGSYPQSEITDSNITAAIDSAIAAGEGTAADAGMDVWVNGVKYRRISKADATFGGKFGDNTYRYFKWEKIKWRVLKNNGTTLFLMADMGLDCKKYHTTVEKVTWENCDLRKWLNDSFYNLAFNENEQKAIVTQTVVNADNWQTIADGGNDTKDNVYLLSMDEAMNSDYGFCTDFKVFSASRRLQISDYTVGKGSSRSVWEAYAGNAGWWLRSPGSIGSERDDGTYVSFAVSGTYVGQVSLEGDTVTFNWAVAPVLHADLKSDQWSLTDDSDGKVIEKVQTPKANVAGGAYNAVQTVTLSSATEKAVIYYTTDGSEPNIVSGIKYKDAITVNSSLTLKAIAVKSGMKDSDVMTEQYSITLPGSSGETGKSTQTENKNDSSTTVEEAEKKITSTNTDKGDVAGSKFATLQLKATGKSKSVKLTWKKVKDADGYIIYGSRCGKSMKKIKTLKGNTKTSYTQKKLAKGKYYKYMVVAYKNVDGKKCTIATSKSAHAVTSGGKYGNPTKVTVKASKLTIKKGKKKTIKASYTLPKGKKASILIAKFRYESSNTKVATVSKKGVVKGKKKGTAYIYVYAQNGVYKKVKVTVK